MSPRALPKGLTKRPLQNSATNNIEEIHKWSVCTWELKLLALVPADHEAVPVDKDVGSTLRLLEVVRGRNESAAASNRSRKRLLSFAPLGQLLSGGIFF